MSEEKEDASTYELLALFDRDDEAAVKTLARRCASSAQDRQTVAAAALVERLLGPAGDAHPRTDELLAAIDHHSGNGGAEVELHLSSCSRCRELVAAARSGLAEAAEIERGLQWLAAGKSKDAGQDTTALPPLVPLAVTRPVAVAMAATQTDTQTALSPLPQERRSLVSERDFELVYLRRGARALIGLFSDEREQLQIAVRFGDRQLAAAVDEDGAVLFALGPVDQLFGQRIEVTIDGAARGRWRWSFFESEPDDDSAA